MLFCRSYSGCCSRHPPWAAVVHAFKSHLLLLVSGFNDNFPLSQQNRVKGTEAAWNISVVAASSSCSHSSSPVIHHLQQFLVCALLLASSLCLVLEVTFGSNLQQNTGGKLKVTGNKIGSATPRDLRCCTVREGCGEVTVSRNIWGMERSNTWNAAGCPRSKHKCRDPATKERGKIQKENVKRFSGFHGCSCHERSLFGLQSLIVNVLFHCC